MRRPARSASLLTVAMGLSLGCSAWLRAADAVPAGDAAAADQKKSKQLETVIVTGTHAENRTASSSLAPIDVLSSQALQSTGSTDLASALTKLEPSLNFPMPADADGSASQRPLSMRGLSPDMVLVLVDGKRYHTASYVNTDGLGYGTAPVDLNTIPLSMVDHIEVLRDGASAQYGSDAIAGVVNIVLKHGAQGGSVNLTGGKYSAGDGGQYLATANFGLPLGEGKGWIRFDLEDGYTGVINRSQPNVFDRAVGQPGQGGTPSIRHKSANFNGQYDITPGVQLYFYGINTWRDSSEAMNYRYPYLKYADYSSTQVGSAAGGFKGYPEYALYPDGYQPHLENKSQDNELVAGLRGTFGDGWHWDVAGNYGRNKLAFYTNHSINKAWYLDTGQAPTDYYDGTFKNKQQIVTADVTKDFNLSWLPNAVTVAFGAEYMKENYSLAPGDLDSYYATTHQGRYPDSGTPQAGVQGFTGYSPEAAGAWGRHNLSEYVSLETNLTDKLGTSLAVRHEDYSDFGNTVNAALSGRYDFTDDFALRGSFSTGFKAPSLAQSFFSEVASAGYTVDQGVPVAGLYNGGIFRTTNPVAVLLGAKPLKPEKSKNYSLGAVWSPLEDLTLTADVYQIDIRDRITLSGSIPTIYASVPAYGQYISDFLAAHGDTASYASVQYMMNGLNTRTRGFDLVADYSYHFGNGGRLQSTLSFNVTNNRVTGFNPPPAGLQALQAQFPGVPLTKNLFSRSLVKGIFEHSAPNNKLVLTETYLQGPWTLNATLTRYGRVTEYADSGHAGTLVTPLYPDGIDTVYDQTYAPKWILDLAATYDYGHWSFTLGADNVFNTYPTKNNYYNNQTNVIPYPTISPFGFYGAYAYGKVGFHW